MYQLQTLSLNLAFSEQGIEIFFKYYIILKVLNPLQPAHALK